MKIFVDDEFMTVSEEDSILKLKWKEGTSELNNEKFKIEARKFIKVVEERDSKKIIVDMRNFRYSLDEDIIEWRNRNVITLYNKVGVKKFAFITEEPTVKQDNPENTFVTKSFTDEEGVINWLSSG